VQLINLALMGTEIKFGILSLNKRQFNEEPNEWQLPKKELSRLY
jgi:hypothetical protein